MIDRRRKIKRDIRDRRTDRVKRSEIRQMEKRCTQGYSPEEIAKELKRDPRTVKRHLCQLDKIDRGAAQRARAYSGVMRRHCDALWPVLRELEEIDVLPLHSRVETWLSHPAEPSWPVPKGYVCWGKDGKLSVRLDVETRREWKYLQQHYTGDPLWDAIKGWKLAMAQDLTTRQALFQALLSRIESPVEQGGTGLPVIRDVNRVAERQPSLHLYYVFTIYDQVISRLLGMRLAPKTRDEFVPEEGGNIHLGAYLVVMACDHVQAERAISFLLEAQAKLVELPEAVAAAGAYAQAEEQTRKVKEELRRILVAPGLPPDSICDGCRPWVEASRAGQFG